MAAHYQPAQFVAAFGSEDPGRLDVAPAFIKDLPAPMYVHSTFKPVRLLMAICSVNATLAGIGVQEIEAAAAKIPINVAYGTQACLDRCGIERPGMWTPAAIAYAKRQFEEFMSQGPVRPADFHGLPGPK
jgi:hypothetical protein